MVGVGLKVGVGDTVGVGLNVGVGETVGVGDSVSCGASVGTGVSVGAAVGADAVASGASGCSEEMSFPDAVISPAGFIKEPASITTKKQTQVAANPISVRCVFFIVNPETFRFIL